MSAPLAPRRTTPRRARLAVALALGLAVASGCRAAPSPELRVLGVHDQARREVVFVQVSNPARRAMRLTKLTYSFAADGATLSQGEVALAREVPAGEAVVLEIPLDATPAQPQPLTLSGRLTAELDQIIETFAVSAQVQPSK